MRAENSLTFPHQKHVVEALRKAPPARSGYHRSGGQLPALSLKPLTETLNVLSDVNNLRT